MMEPLISARLRLAEFSIDVNSAAPTLVEVLSFLEDL